MNVTVGVTIDAEGTSCGLDCPWLDLFGVKPDSEDPQPRCSLCDRFLNEGEDGPLRCGDCIDKEMDFKEQARRYAMRNAGQNKTNGVSAVAHPVTRLPHHFSERGAMQTQSGQRFS